MKIAVLGRGSSYTPELVNGLLERAGWLALDELWLMDIVLERLEAVGALPSAWCEPREIPFQSV